MKKLKVYGGNVFIGHNQVRAILATTSQKRVAEIMDVPLHKIQNYWAETRSKSETSIALSNPNVAYMHQRGIFIRLDCIEGLG